MFSSIIHDYIHTIIDTKYTKRTKVSAHKYCDEVISEFLNIFAELNPDIIKYLDKQTYAEYKPAVVLFKVSLYMDLFKPIVQNWVSSVLLEKKIDDRLSKSPMITKITRLIYVNLYSKRPASKFAISDFSKSTPTFEAIEFDDSEENLVNACSKETFKFLEYKSKIETGEMTKFACLLHIEEHDEEFPLMKKYTRHIVELILDIIVDWNEKKHDKTSKVVKSVPLPKKRKVKPEEPEEESEEQENQINKLLRSVVNKIPNDVSPPQPPKTNTRKSFDHRKQSNDQLMNVLAAVQQPLPSRRIQLNEYSRNHVDEDMIDYNFDESDNSNYDDND